MSHVMDPRGTRRSVGKSRMTSGVQLVGLLALTCMAAALAAAYIFVSAIVPFLSAH